MYKRKLAFDPDLSVTVTIQLSWIQKIEKKRKGYLQKDHWVS